MNKQILIIDDSKTCQLIARETLKHLGQITKAMNIHEARESLLSKTFDIVIFDVFLPDGSGVEFLGELRTMDISQNSIFIVTTSDTEVSKKIAAFSLGADDYLTKPYSPLELRARVERYLKVHSRDLFADVRSGLRLNTANYRAFKTTAGQEKDLSLTPQEFKILNLLLRHPDRIYSRTQIVDLAWGSDVHIVDRTVDTHISTLRKKLGPLGSSIVNIRGEGYKWLPGQSIETAA